MEPRLATATGRVRQATRASYLVTLLGAMAAAAFLVLGSSPARAQGQARAVAAGSAVPVTYVLVTFDRTALRAAPRDSAPVQAELTQGDLLEVRGLRLDHLQVYDHRRERAGFVRGESVRRIAAASTARADEAAELLSVVRFLRHTSGQEALGIAYVAAYLQAAAAERIDAEPFDRAPSRTEGIEGTEGTEGTAGAEGVDRARGPDRTIAGPHGASTCCRRRSLRQGLAMSSSPAGYRACGRAC
jgi:hypothetical protein